MPSTSRVVAENTGPSSLHNAKINLLVFYKIEGPEITHVMDLPGEEVKKIKEIFNAIDLPNASIIDLPGGISIEALKKKNSEVNSFIEGVVHEASFLERVTRYFPCFK